MDRIIFTKQEAYQPSIQMLLPREYRGFHEPFAGGGSLTFALKPLGGYLSDLNPELINFYRVLKQKPRALAGHLNNLRIEDKHFHDLRAMNLKAGSKLISLHFNESGKAFNRSLIKLLNVLSRLNGCGFSLTLNSLL